MEKKDLFFRIGFYFVVIFYIHGRGEEQYPNEEWDHVLINHFYVLSRH